VIIDCDSCVVRDLECDDCVVTALLGSPPSELDDSESTALAVLAGSGLVPPLRLVTRGPAGKVRERGDPSAATG